MSKPSIALMVLLLLVSGSGCQPSGAGTEFDLVIVDGQVVDGSGSPPFAADLGIQGDTIVRIGSIEEIERQRAGLLIDAAGLVVSPGFIDIHSHSDYSLLVDGTARSKIFQGVTTEILGESRSAGPIKGKAPTEGPYSLTVDWTTLGGYYDRLDSDGISVNVGSYVGATQVRLCVLGYDSRDPVESEMLQMKELVKEAMQDGALGLSSALLVPPNTYITTDQLIELASVVKPYGGIYSTHIRSEGKAIQQAVQEAITIGEQAQVPVDIIHLKIADWELWGQMKEICELIEQARARGVEVGANQYPYIAGQNNLVALIPPWAMEGGREEMLERLKSNSDRRRLARDIYDGVPGWFNHYLAMEGWQGCLVASVTSENNKHLEGKSVAEIAQITGKEPTDAVFDLLLEEKGSVPAVYFLMSEEDVRYAMRKPWVSFGSDGTAVRPDGLLGAGKPHPRWYGTFPRILGRYVRQDQVLPLHEAIRKMTLLNAQKLGFSDRGLLKEGYKADVTVFDSAHVLDKATFDNPHQYSVGIQHVIVNGTQVLESGRHLGVTPGRILKNRTAEN